MDRRLLGRALDEGVPFGWVTGDSVYGNDWRMRSWLEERDLSYLLGVTAQYRIFTGREREWASAVVGRLGPKQWRRLSCGSGSKGERVYDWALVPLREVEGGRARWLLARRSLTDQAEVSYYVASGPRHTALKELARVAGARWAIEESFETAKGEVGLDQYEVRSWHGWRRHITLALLAHAYLTVTRAHAAVAEAAAQKKRGRERARGKQRG